MLGLNSHYTAGQTNDAPTPTALYFPKLFLCLSFVGFFFFFFANRLTAEAATDRLRNILPVAAAAAVAQKK